MIAKIQEYDITIYITGIDMSSAFDTIHRNEMINIAERILQEDEVRILRVLLSNTTLEVRVKGAETQPFTSNIGSPQGDSISGPLFTAYFEEALKELREEITPVHERDHNYTETESSLPGEVIYADDYDHITDNKDKRDRFKHVMKTILREKNLHVNEDKTEDTVLKRGDRNTEIWRNVRKVVIFTVVTISVTTTTLFLSEGTCA